MFVCDPNIVLRHPISGQDFYLQRVITTMKRLGFKVLILHPQDVKVLSNKMRILRKGDDLNLHMHYVHLSDILRSRTLFPKAKHMLYVYQLKDPTWSIYGELGYKAFLYLTATSKLVNYYITPSHILSKELGFIVGSENVKVLGPYYPCDETLRELLINKKARDLETKHLEVLYIGRLNIFRIDLTSIIKSLKILANKGFNIRFRLVSMKEMGLPIQHKIVELNNLKIELIGRRLKESEKAEIYSKAHILLFIAKGYSAMRPPLSIIESVCYGVIPVISPIITEFTSIRDIVIESTDIDTIVEKLGHIINAFEMLNKRIFTSFKDFYSKERFLRQLLAILSEAYEK